MVKHGLSGQVYEVFTVIHSSNLTRIRTEKTRNLEQLLVLLHIYFDLTNIPYSLC